MRFILAAALAMIAVPAHAQVIDVMQDRGNEFTRTEWDRTSGMNVRIISYKNRAELNAAARAAGIGIANTRNMNAFSTMPVNPGGVCTIHTLNPKVNTVRTDLGHELMHCAYGRWHD